MTGKKKKRKKKKTNQKSVAFRLTYCPTWAEHNSAQEATQHRLKPSFFSFFFLPPSLRWCQSSMCQPPHTAGPGSPLLFIQVCSIWMEIKRVVALTSPSFVNPHLLPPVKSRCSRAVRTVLDASWEDQRAGTVLTPGRGRPRRPSEGVTGSLTSSLQSPLCL